MAHRWFADGRRYLARCTCYDGGVAGSSVDARRGRPSAGSATSRGYLSRRDRPKSSHRTPTSGSVDRGQSRLCQGKFEPYRVRRSGRRMEEHTTKQIAASIGRRRCGVILVSGKCSHSRNGVAERAQSRIHSPLRHDSDFARRCSGKRICRSGWEGVVQVVFQILRSDRAEIDAP